MVLEMDAIYRKSKKLVIFEDFEIAFLNYQLCEFSRRERLRRKIEKVRGSWASVLSKQSRYIACRHISLCLRGIKLRKNVGFCWRAGVIHDWA